MWIMIAIAVVIILVAGRSHNRRQQQRLDQFRNQIEQYHNQQVDCLLYQMKSGLLTDGLHSEMLQEAEYWYNTSPSARNL
jgi:hypothetical protein